MRVGLVADVHANIHALEAVLAELGPVDALICAGDVVGYGPRPNECVERIAALGALTVVGNHDLMALGGLEPPARGLVAESTAWTRAALTSDSIAWLERLPGTARTDDGIVVAHGSLADPTEYVRDCARAEAELASLGADVRLLVLGHTHHPLECRGVVNPGSVGQSRERRPLARGAVLEGETARFVAVDYDVAATRRELRSAGLPEHMCHLAPGALARWRRRGAAALRRPRPASS